MQESVLPPTRLEQWRFVQGWHVNARGILFGGALLSWLDEDATMLAYKVSISETTEWSTVGMDRIRFFRPTERGQRLRCCAEVAHVGQTSLTVEYKVYDCHDEVVFEALATQVCVSKYAGVPSPLILTDEVSLILPVIKDRPIWKVVEKIKAERKTDSEA